MAEHLEVPRGTRVLQDELLGEAVTLTLEHWLQLGLTINQACTIAGVTSVKFHRWLRLGEEEDPENNSPREPYITFALRIRRAELHAAGNIVQAWTEAARSDWKAGAKFMAARFPEEWSERRIQRNPEASGPTTITVNIKPRDGAEVLPEYDPGYGPELAAQELLRDTEGLERTGQGQGREAAGAVPPIDRSFSGDTMGGTS